MTITGNDSNAYTLSGGSSVRSANATQGVAAGQTLFATAPVVNGARRLCMVCWGCRLENAAGDHPIDSAAFSAPLATGQQPATAVAADGPATRGWRSTDC